MAGVGVTVWLDGRVWREGQDARIAALDHGVTVGDGVFETLKVVDGVPFALTRHLRRLDRSAAVLALECPPAATLVAATQELMDAAQSIPLGRLRITLTGGPGPLGSDRGQAAATLILAVTPAVPWPEQIAAVTVPWVRNERSAIAGAKTTSYAENVVALRRAHQQGAHEALLTNTAGLLCEGTGSNVAVERGGLLVTPPLSSGCLAGITRELFLEWATHHGLPLLEDAVTLGELAAAPEVLLMSSTRDVQHVCMMDGRPLDPSPLGKAAVELFSRCAAEAVDP
jgi:branched-chain amino acid aminotransferase